MDLTPKQWEALLDASHGIGNRHHGKTLSSLERRGLITWNPLAPTIKGRNALYARYAAGLIGHYGEE